MMLRAAASADTPYYDAHMPLLRGATRYLPLILIRDAGYDDTLMPLYARFDIDYAPPCRATMPC